MSRRLGRSSKSHPKRGLRPRPTVSPVQLPDEDRPVTEENVLAFEQAANMTVGEAVKKGADLEAGVTASDSALDRYIKHHPDEIASRKYRSQQTLDSTTAGTNEEAASGLTAADELALEQAAQRLNLVTPAPLETADHLETDAELEMSDALEETAQATVPTSDLPSPQAKSPKAQTTQFDPLEVTETEQADALPSAAPVLAETSEDTKLEPVVTPQVASRSEVRTNATSTPKSKRKAVFWTTLAVLGFAALVIAAMLSSETKESVAKPAKSAQTSTSSSSKLKGIITSASSTSTSASDKSKEALAFDKQYAGFFTDGEQDTLKNSQFGKLSELKKTLDKVKDKEELAEAKAKYKNLEAAIQGIKAVNGQFNKALIVDGVLDTTAQVKESAKFQATATGISKVDALLASAINFGRSQLDLLGVEESESASRAAAEAAAAAEAEKAKAEAEAAEKAEAEKAAAEKAAAEKAAQERAASQKASSEAAASKTQTSTSTTPSSTTTTPAVNITEQRALSRVPYNQAAINDTSNAAWAWTPGVLDRIVATSHQRGYFSGSEYYVEPVNIINGNGYYNMFKSDGTYLFSINAKTGYFFGNGSGRPADY